MMTISDLLSVGAETFHNLIAGAASASPCRGVCPL